MRRTKTLFPAKPAKTQGGVAIVEFALILPLLLLLSVMTVEIGRAVMQYNTLTKSVREAVRYLSSKTPGTGLDEARNIVLYGDPAGGTVTRLPGLTAANVQTPVWGTKGSSPPIGVVTVTVSGYAFDSMISSFQGINFGPIVFGAISATMRTEL